MVSDHLDISPSGTAPSSASSQSIEHSRVQLFRFDATACSAGGSLAAPATQVGLQVCIDWFSVMN